MYQWIKDRAASGSIELLHNHSLWMLPNVYPGWVASRHQIPLVVSPRGTLSGWAFQSGSQVKKVFWPLIQKPALAATTCFHATAKSEYEDIRRMGFRQPVAIIPNGVDLPRFRRKVLNDVRTLLFLGRIHPKKGVDLLLEAWFVVSKRFPEWRLRIVGPDNIGYLQKMRSLAARLGLERIEFSGPLYGEAKREAYQEAELFVLPTHSENFGMTVAESLAAGTPAIVTKGAPWEGLEEYRAGWWIDLGKEPLVACLEEALALGPHTLEAMGRRGRSWMAEAYSWRRIAQQMAATYRWILQGGASPDWVVVT